MKFLNSGVTKISFKSLLGIAILSSVLGVPCSVSAQEYTGVPAPVSEVQPEVVDVNAPQDNSLEPATPEIDAIGQDLSQLPDAIEDDVDENIFFDANALVPSGEMGRKSGPKKVNPRTQPASKLVTVRKNNTAGSKTAQLVSADRAMKLARYDSALEIYNRLYATNKRDPNILMGRAVALQHLGREDEAISAYDELLKRRPENIDAQINMLGLMAGQYPAVALQRLEVLFDKESSNPGVIAQLAFIHAKMTNYGDAIRYLGMAASIEPQNANHVYNMAVIADRAGSKNEAISYYERALEVDTLYGAGETVPRDSIFARLAQLR
jgi:tetratricopeptide (TPR) repeat protein